jgi:DNA-binding NtrC family response regulator
VPLQVLVVDDEPIVSKLICRLLEEAGFGWIAADSGEQALALLSQGTVPDVALLDIRLPDVLGPSVALRLHELHPHIPVLFVSAWVDGLANTKSLDPLRWEFLPKPFRDDALLAAIRRLTDVEGRQAALSAQ